MNAKLPDHLFPFFSLSLFLSQSSSSKRMQTIYHFQSNQSKIGINCSSSVCVCSSQRTEVSMCNQKKKKKETFTQRNRKTVASDCNKELKQPET